MEQVQIYVVPGTETPAELDRAVRMLCTELSAHNLRAQPLQTTEPPLNAKSPTIGAAQALTVAVLSSGSTVALIGVLQDWLNRHRTLRIRVKIGSSTVEVSGASPEAIKELIPELEALLHRLAKTE